jgi:hypothetical protein
MISSAVKTKVENCQLKFDKIGNSKKEKEPNPTRIEEKKSTMIKSSQIHLKIGSM